MDDYGVGSPSSWQCIVVEDPCNGGIEGGEIVNLSLPGAEAALRG